MAKKSAIENNLRKQRLAKKFAGRRKRLLDIANDDTRPMEERFEARLQARRASAQRRDHPGAQPLRGDRPSARLLPQDEDVAHRACANWATRA